MRFVIALVISFALVWLCAKPLKKHPVPFYLGAIALLGLYFWGTATSVRNEVWAYFQPLMQRCALAFLLFSIVMFVGVLGERNPLRVHLMPIRMIEAEADLDRVLVIDEAKRELTLSDERIEKAITQNGARLIILDPIQAYMGEKTDMNRANEVRPMFRRLADVAERTGCAVILIGHLNKAAGGQSAYRGLGSIDFRAAARSVLLIGRVKREPNVRVIVHDKSSLAPEGKPVAFCLDPETGFEWIGEYDITADELLSGAGGNTATKTEQAERLILDLLAGGKELASEDIVKAAAEAGISERTAQNAKRNMGGILGARRVGGQWYNFIKKKQPPEPAS